MNLKSAARRLGVHYQTAYKWVRSGELVAVKIGLNYEVSEAAIERFLAQRSAPASGPDPGAPGALPGPGPVLAPASSDRTAVLAGLERATARVILDAMPVLTMVVQRAAQILGDVAVARLISTDGLWAEPVAYYHTNPERYALIGALISSVQNPVDAGIASDVVRSGKAVLVDHVPQDWVRAKTLPEFRQYLDQIGIHSLVMAPILVATQVIGVLGVSRDKPGHPYTPADREFVEALAALVARAIEQARHFALAWRERKDLTERLEVLLAAEYHRGDGVPGAPLDAMLEDCLAGDDAAEAVLGLDGAFLAVSGRFCELLGYEREELVGLGCRDVTPPDDRPHEDRRMAQLASGELDFYDEDVRRIKKDGTVARCFVHRSAARDPGSTLRYIVTVLRPVED